MAELGGRREEHDVSAGPQASQLVFHWKVGALRAELWTSPTYQLYPTAKQVVSQ